MPEDNEEEECKISNNEINIQVGKKRKRPKKNKQNPQTPAEGAPTKRRISIQLHNN